MSGHWLWLAAATVLACLAVPADAAEAKVLNTKKQLDEVLFAHEKVFVKFMVPWCGHSKKLRPAWHELAEMHDVPDSGTRVVMVDCAAEKDDAAACKAHGVEGFPTITLFMDKGFTAKEYTGPRKLADFENFLVSNGDVEEQDFYMYPSCGADWLAAHDHAAYPHSPPGPTPMAPIQ